MSPRWRKVLRDLWINKTRTILVVLSIAVGVFAIGVIAGTQAVLSREVLRVYTASRAASASVSSIFDDDFVSATRRMAGVADAEGRSEVVVRAHAGDELRSLVLVAVHDFNDIRVNKFRSVGGAWPPPKRELLLERSATGPLHATLGSTITVELPNGTERTLRVAGLVYDFQSPPPILGGMSYGYISLDTLEWLGFPRTYNQLDIVVAEDGLNRQHIQDVANEIKDRVEKEQGHTVSAVRIPDPGKPVLDSAVQAILLILGVLGALSLLASGFLIVNVIAALLAQQIRQIGMMKAIGARGYQIFGMYLVMVVVLGILGLCLAVPSGILGAQALSRYGASLLNVEVADIGVPPQVFLLQIAVGLAVPVLASLYPVLSGTRVTVHEAVNSYGVGARFGEHRVDRFITRIHTPRVSRPLLLSLRNTFRRKGRLAFTLSTLTLGGAIFVGVFCVRASLLRTLADSLGYWNYNVVAYTNRFYPVEQLQRQALGVPGVVQAEAWGSDSAVRVFPDRSESRSFGIIAPPAQTRLLSPIVVQGRWLLSDDGNALVINSDMLADHPDLYIGSTLRLKLDEHESSWQVVGIVRSVLTGRIAYMNYPAYARAARQFGRASSVVVVTDKSDANTESRIASSLEDHFKLVGMQTSATSTTTAERATHEYQFGLLVTFLALMALLLAVVGGLGLMGTMSINVLERIREIGVMRAVGASDGAVMGIIITEGVFIGLVSWLFGIGLAWPIAHFLGLAIGTTMLREQLTDTFSPLGVGLWLLIVLVISALASFVPAARAARLSVREVLSYE